MRYVTVYCIRLRSLANVFSQDTVRVRLVDVLVGQTRPANRWMQANPPMAGWKRWLGKDWKGLRLKSI